MPDRLCTITHLLQNIIDKCPFNEDDSPRLYAPGKPATRPNVDDQIRLEMIDHILSRRSSRDFTPASMEEYQVPGVKFQVGRLPIWGIVNFKLGH